MSFLSTFLLPLAGITAIACYHSYYRYQNQRHRRHIHYLQNYTFLQRPGKELKKRYPFLTDEQIEQVLQALREYFMLCRSAGKKMVSMPSQAVDVAWHEFILDTWHYQQFCKNGFGYFLHHTPAESMRSPTAAQEGIKLAWKLACQREHIDPQNPPYLPLLFAVDALLGIPDGFHYSLDCMKSADGKYCASHIGCSSGCGGGLGYADSNTSSSDSQGGHSGDGGGGCGGGGD